MTSNSSKGVRSHLLQHNEKVLKGVEQMIDYYQDDPRRWIKGHYTAFHGYRNGQRVAYVEGGDMEIVEGHCLMGLVSIVRVAGLEEVLYKAIDVEIPGYNVVAWNDRAGRTYEDVMLLLKRCAVQLECEISELKNESKEAQT